MPQIPLEPAPAPQLKQLIGPAFKLGAKVVPGLTRFTNPLGWAMLGAEIALELYRPTKPQDPDIPGGVFIPSGWGLRSTGDAVPQVMALNIPPAPQGWVDGDPPFHSNLGGQAVTPVTVLPPTSYFGTWELYDVGFGQQRATTAASYYKASPDAEMPYARPFVPGAPAQLPRIPYRALPYRAPNPWRVNDRQAGYGPRASPRYQPARDIRGNPVPYAHQHRREPPPKGVKEKKMYLGVRGRPGELLIGGLTESMDLLDSLHKGLPKRLQAKPKDGHYKASPQAKLLAVYTHFGDIDVPTALKEILANQLEDRILGTVGRHVGKASRKLNLSVGVQTGPAF